MYATTTSQEIIGVLYLFYHVKDCYVIIAECPYLPPCRMADRRMRLSKFKSSFHQIFNDRLLCKDKNLKYYLKVYVKEYSINIPIGIRISLKGITYRLVTITHYILSI